MWLAYFQAVGREVPALVVEALQAGGVAPKSSAEQSWSPSHTHAAHPPPLGESWATGRGPADPAAQGGGDTREGVKDDKGGCVPPAPPAAPALPACLSWDTESLWEEVQPAPLQWGALATPPPVLAKGLNLLF